MARCTLQMHSADGTRHGLAVGDTVALSSTAGEIHVPLEIDDDIRPGVVSMTHGWGHSDPHSRLTVAKAHAGTHTHILSPGTMVDSIYGNAVFYGIQVQVHRGEPPSLENEEEWVANRLWVSGRV